MEPLIVAKQEALRPTITFAISGKNVSLKTLKTIGRQVENDLRAIEGISQIETTGYPEEEIEIAVNETRLLAYDLSFQDIANAVNQSSLIATGGTIKTSSEDYLIRANSRAYQANELSNLVLKADASGRIITLKEVATVSDRFSETPNANYFNGNRAINVTVTSTNTEDLISSADKVKAYMAVFNKTHDAIQLNVVRDRSITLVQRTALLTENAIIGMVLVLLFLSVFLNVRLAFWVAFGLPVAFLGMFMFAGYFNVTINVLSLFGMIIVIGILVDDGIVIAENIYQQYEKGKPAHKAAIDGVLEVLPAIISAILTTILAFSIFLFLDGRIGELFGEVSVVVLLTLVVSLVEALIILPAHLAHSKALQSKDSVIKSGWNGLFQRLSLKLGAINVVGDRIMVWLRDTLYSPVLRFALRYKFLTFSLFIAIFILTRASVLGGIIRGAFFPRIASDRVTITLNMPNGTNAKTTDSIIKDIEDKAIVVTNQMHMSYLGSDAKAHLVKNRIRRIGPGTSRAVLEINLLPGEDRPNAITAGLVTNKIRDYVGPVFGVESLIYGSGGNFGGQPLSVALLGNDIKALKAVKEELKHYLKNTTFSTRTRRN
jgi:multidrug efflux pump subunit AcrB